MAKPDDENILERLRQLGDKVTLGLMAIALAALVTFPASAPIAESVLIGGSFDMATSQTIGKDLSAAYDKFVKKLKGEDS